MIKLMSNVGNYRLIIITVSKLYHEIFGHINYKYISYLSEKHMVIGMVTKDQVF